MGITHKIHKSQDVIAQSIAKLLINGGCADQKQSARINVTLLGDLCI